MFYEMLTGEPPFRGPNPLAVMNERVLHDPEPARDRRPEISPALNEILNRALERDPRRRYQTASEMALELENRSWWAWTMAPAGRRRREGSCRMRGGCCSMPGWRWRRLPFLR